MFLANKGNKQRFIDMLGQKLEEEGCEVHYSEGDADFDIVKTAVEVSANVNTVVVGEDTDLLILLLYHAKRTQIKSSSVLSKSKMPRRRVKYGIFSCASTLSMHPVSSCLSRV